MEVRLVLDIAKIEAEWELFEANIEFENSYKWYKNNLSVLSDTIYFFCVYEDEKLQAILPVHKIKKPIVWSFNNPIKFLNGENYHMDISYKSELPDKNYYLVTSPFGFQSGIINLNSFSKEKQIEMLDRLDSFVKIKMQEEKVSELYYLYVKNNAPLSSYYRNDSFQLPIIYDCVANTAWNSFDEFLEHEVVSAKWKSEIRRERRAFEKKKLKIEKIIEFKALANTLARLEGNLLTKYGYQDSVDLAYSENWYIGLNDTYGDKSYVYVVRNAEDKVLGFSLFIEDRNGKRMCAKAAGFDYECLPKNAYAYFNVVYYTPIEEAVKAQINSISFGCEMYEVKVKRGCKLAQYNLLAVFTESSAFHQLYDFDKAKSIYRAYMDKIGGAHA